jgi:hypothetical protein
LLNRRKYQIGQGFSRIGLADASGGFGALLQLIWGGQAVSSSWAKASMLKSFSLITSAAPTLAKASALKV